MTTALDALLATVLTLPPGAAAAPARFALILSPDQEPLALAAAIEAEFAPLGARVVPLSSLERRVLVLKLPGRVFGAEDRTAFAAAYALADQFGLEAAEPDLPTPFFPEPPPSTDRMDPAREGLFDDPLGCFAPPQPELADDWALNRMRVPDAWALSDALGRPARGLGVVVGQPDTGVTPHAELAGMMTVPGRDVLDDDDDPTDPLLHFGNPGHGTGTASVLASPAPGRVTGAAPLSRHMAIRAIESVVRVTQVTVAEGMDWAVGHGAQVITMSLGGIPSFALHRALRRAVAADVIVLAAAGNCVKTVVWPARYDECIAVAGTDADDAPWRGTCRGAAVAISAPGQNVLRASLVQGQPPGADVAQGQGTSFAVAQTAGIAALWLAHHGRANLVGAARARNETLQAMFRRLLRATARRPAGWDGFEMGAGVVDARALLVADFDLGRDLESLELPSDPAVRSAATVASLAAETLGPEAAADVALDWHKFGPEVALALLRRQMAVPADLPPGARTEAAGGPPPVSAGLASAVLNPLLRQGLGLDDGFQSEAGVGPGRAMSAPQTEHLRRLVAVRSRAMRGGGLESVDQDEALAAGPGADDVTGRVEARLHEVLQRMPADEVGDPREFRRALETLLLATQRTARKLDADPEAALSRGEALTLEAVVRTDGSRPSLLIRNGMVDAEHPLAGDWGPALADTAARLRGKLQAVGRIEPAFASPRNFFGTGWVVDAGKGLVLTNLHVLEAMWGRLSNVMARTASGFRILDGAFIDFAAETGAVAPNRFRIVEATPSGIDGPGFARLDAALLKVEPTAPDVQQMPGAIGVLARSGRAARRAGIVLRGRRARTARLCRRGARRRGLGLGERRAVRQSVRGQAPGPRHRPQAARRGAARAAELGVRP